MPNYTPIQCTIQVGMLGQTIYFCSLNCDIGMLQGVMTLEYTLAFIYNESYTLSTCIHAVVYN